MRVAGVQTMQTSQTSFHVRNPVMALKHRQYLEAYVQFVGGHDNVPSSCIYTQIAGKGL